MDSLPDVFAKLPIQVQWIFAVILALTVLGYPLPTILGWLRRLPMFNMWSKRNNWVAQSVPTPSESDIYGQSVSDPNNAWRKDAGRWSNGKKMEVGDWYELKFDKPRILSEIIVYSEGQRFPQKINFYIKESLNSQWKFETAQKIDLKESNKDTIFKYRFKKHQKVAGIKLEILEPTLEPLNPKGWSPAWGIYNMDFKEYRLFGCLWETSIK